MSAFEFPTLRSFLFGHSSDSFIDVDVDRIVTVDKVAGIEERANRLDVGGAEGVGENGAEIFDPFGRGLETLGVEEGDGQRSGVDRVRAIAEFVGVDAVDFEAAVAILKRGDAVVQTFGEQFHRFAAELRRVITIEQNRSPAALGVADLANENRGVGRFVAVLAREKGVADVLDQEPFDRLGRAGVLHVAGGVFAGRDRAEDVAFGVADSFGDAQDGVFLEVQDVQDPFDQGVGIDRGFGNKNDVGLAVGGTERDHAAVSAHDFDDGDSSMALGGRADALNAGGRDVNGGREAGSDVVDHLVETEIAAGVFANDIPSRGFGGMANPFAGLVGIIQAEVVIDRLGGEDAGQIIAKRLHAVERAVAADANQAVNVKARQTAGDAGDRRRIVAVNIVARCSQDRAAASRVEFGNALKQRVEMNMRHLRIEQAAEPLDDAEDFHAKLIGALTAPSIVAFKAGVSPPAVRMAMRFMVFLFDECSVRG